MWFLSDLIAGPWVSPCPFCSAAYPPNAMKMVSLIAPQLCGSLNFCFTGSLRPCVLAPLRFPRAPLQRKDARAQRRKGGFFTTARASRVADRTSSTESGVVDICASPDVLGIFEQEATERTEEDMTSVTSVSSCSQWFRGGLQPVRQTTWNQITHAL